MGARRQEAGETLIEVLLATVILAVVGLGAFKGLGASVSVSDAKQSNAASEAALRSAAEHLQDPDVPYVDCATGASYGSALPSPPAGYTYSATVRYWVEPNTSPSATVLQLDPAFQTSCVKDAGLQKITVSIADHDGRQRTIDVMKRRR